MQRGDTVDELLRRLSIEDPAASEYLRKSADAASFRKLPVGTEVQAETTATGGLIALRYLGNDSAQIMIDKQEGVFQTKTLPAQLENRLFVRTGEIKTNLYAATDEAGLPDAAANQLNELFSGDIDFHHDLRKGDRFTVVYEMTYSNGALLHTGRIQAAEFINQGHVYRALYFQKDAAARRLLHPGRQERTQSLPAFTHRIFARKLAVFPCPVFTRYSTNGARTKVPILPRPWVPKSK